MPDLLCLCILIVLLWATSGGAAFAIGAKEIEMQTVVYKTTPQGELMLDLYQPATAELAEPAMRPAMVFFHGGAGTAVTKTSSAVSPSTSPHGAWLPSACSTA